MEFSEVIEKPRINNVTLRRSGMKNEICNGALAITAHHLIFQPASPSIVETMILHRSIDVCTSEIRGSIGVLTLCMKNLQVLQLELSIEDSQAVQRTEDVLCNLSDINLLYPFWWKCSWQIVEDGWGAFSIEQEFSRLQVQSRNWKLSRINAGYSLCPTYPEVVIIPNGVDDDAVRISASFRHGGRFPVLSYYHKATNSVLARCSQPLVGPNNRRCREDEQLMNAMLSQNNKGYIIDTRSTAMAQACKAKGGGFESDMYYNQWKRMHKSLPRFNQLQEAFAKHVEACSTTDPEKWLPRLANAGWLQAVSDVIDLSALAAQCLDKEEMSVLIHGSEGIDTTLLVTSIAQVILDPDTRTFRGFQALIEREWLSAGHPFAQRCAKSAYARGRGTEGATFLLFLDCIYQLYRQFIYSFEFNEDFLVALFDHAYSSEYGTFLCDNEKERRELQIASKTISLWSYFNRPEIMAQYINVLYEPNSAAIWPTVAPQSLVVWEGVFLRWTRDWSQERSVHAKASELIHKHKQLVSSVSKLRRQLIELERESIEAESTA